MTSAELRLQRRNTKAFIDVEPVVLELIPTRSERTAAGGTRWVEDVSRFPQAFRLIPLSGSERAPVVTTQDGRQRSAEYVLLGEFDAEMAIGDIWDTTDGRTWRVNDIVRGNDYETRGLVTERGQ